MISASSLCKSFRDGEGQELQVLAGVDFQVEAGEFVAVVGASGSGKSTLLHILGGLDVHYQGEVSVAGQKLSSLKDGQLARFRNQTVGFVFQSFHLVPNLPVLENIMLPAYFSGEVCGASEQKKAQDLLEHVGLAKKRKSTPAQLSGGERQRVAIARALFMDPKILFCDEPTGNLDAATGAEIIELFKQLNAKGMTILAVTHEDGIRHAASRTLRLTAGKLARQEAAA